MCHFFCALPHNMQTTYFTPRISNWNCISRAVDVVIAITVVIFLWLAVCQFLYLFFSAQIHTYGLGKIVQLSHTGTSLFWLPAAHSLLSPYVCVCVWKRFLFDICFVCLLQIDAYSMFLYTVLPQKLMHLSTTTKLCFLTFMLFLCHTAISFSASQSTYYLYATFPRSKNRSVNCDCVCVHEYMIHFDCKMISGYQME